MRRFAVVCVVIALGCARAAWPAPAREQPAELSVAHGITLIAGSFPEGQQPDGNSVIFSAPDGLIVMDTGRHAEHTQRILDFAAHVKQPIKAVINSHWHLDHIGGNPRVRDVYPDVRIYASGALEGAKTGFLENYRRDLEGALQQMPDDPQAAGWRGELAIIAAVTSPDERIDESGPRVIAGRRLIVHLEKNAVTAGDVWVFDPDTHVLVAGDLVTLPVPFLDTAYPEGWKAALTHLSDTRFKLLVPGHGLPMRRADFEVYRRAFGNLLACAATAEKSADDCVDGWLRGAASLIAGDDSHRVRKMMSYYVTKLRGSHT